MATEKQMQANRENAQKSTGPKTEIEKENPRAGGGQISTRGKNGDTDELLSRDIRPPKLLVFSVVIMYAQAGR